MQHDDIQRARPVSVDLGPRVLEKFPPSAAVVVGVTEEDRDWRGRSSPQQPPATPQQQASPQADTTLHAGSSRAGVDGVPDA